MSESIKKNLSSTYKAITKVDDFTISLRDDVKNNFFAFDKNTIINDDILVSRLEEYSEDVAIKANRFLIDVAASYKLFHDFNIVDNVGESEQIFIDDFEKIRVLSLMDQEFKGCALNILQKIDKEVSYLDDELNSKFLSLVLLGNSIDIQDFPDICQKYDDYTKKIEEIEPKISILIKKLAKNIENQHKFSQIVLEIYKIWENVVNKAEKEQKKDNDDSSESEMEEESEKMRNISKKSDNFPENTENFQENEGEGGKKEENTTKNQERPLENDKKNQNIQHFPPKSYESREDLIEFRHPYKIYTPQYDEIINPQRITDKADLDSLRLELDTKLVQLEKISKKLTTKLKQKLLSKKYRNPNPNDIEGILNRKKLSSIIASPSPRNIYLDHLQNELNDTAVTILLDNSGSMRGRPIIMAALACEILAKILENFQIKTEIIGFTTADWKGGRARKDWEIAGKEKNPGRLNEIRHIIYKSFNQSFEKSKANLGLMLKEGVLKENIDGEAVLFAKSRLQNREEKRKILMVISDGNPIDDSTHLANDDDILSDHLKQVVNNIQKQKQIEILAIGVGHEVGGFYQNSIVIKNLDDLGGAMIEKISSLL